MLPCSIADGSSDAHNSSSSSSSSSGGGSGGGGGGFILNSYPIIHTRVLPFPMSQFFRYECPVYSTSLRRGTSSATGACRKAC